MNRGPRILAGVVAAYAATSLLLAGLRLTVTRENPHAFMKDGARCAECHLEARPAAGRPYKLTNFQKDISSLCSGCHRRPVSHPVDIAPGERMARALPLDPDGTMTCVTCHAPHAAPYSSRIHVGRTLFEKIRDTAFPLVPRKYRTAFLRVPTPEGELCRECHARSPIAAARPFEVPDAGAFAGSGECARCHPRQHGEWKRSPHARMVRSPRKDPGAVMASFAGPAPFPSSEIAYVLGSRTVQRFVSVRGDEFVVRTPIWLIRPRAWNLSYWREMDWLRSCAGCHVTGLDPFKGAFVEEGVGCEACHGPGRAHSRSKAAGDIVNPARLPEPRRSMICEACHTTGHDATGEFRFPVGFRPGGDLTRYYFGLTPKPGQDDASFKGNGKYADRHAQFLFWRTMVLVAEGETCDLCKNFRLARMESEGGERRKFTVDEYCRSCHDGALLPRPRGHEDSRLGGRRCASCHPVMSSADGSPSVHDHKYVPPEALPRIDFIPRPDFTSICYRCHPAPTKGA